MNEAPEVQKRAREIIERTRRAGGTHLDLSSRRLRGELNEIPDAVFDLPQLESLILTDNNIHEVPKKIRNLERLRRLHVVGNPIVRIPDVPGLAMDWVGYLQCREALSRQNVEEIWVSIDQKGSLGVRRARETRIEKELVHLPHLRRLDVGLPSISSNTKLPKPTGEILNLIESIDDLRALESLRFFGILLEKVPEGIRGLKRLDSLTLHAIGLREIPEWVGELGRLRRLSLGANELATLPASLGNLANLEAIDLRDNRFHEIPEAIFRLQSLRWLRIDSSSWRASDGFIKEVPAAILQLENLEDLDVRGQPIEIPPPEIVEEGIEAIKNYWRQQQEVGVDYLCEAKLIIVGEAGAGKTTLAKKLQNPEYTLEPQERSTEGIDVVRWSFPAAVRVKQDGRQNLHRTDFTVNIWDFGGQEIYHATHQFFLTRRSLYALVAGILTRFIVAVNHLIADQDLVWKSGVILEREGSRAEVIEDYPRRKITVRVSGGDLRVLLAIVDDQVERIHASFPRLKYDKFLPCNCAVCQARDEPFAYPLSELKDFAVAGDKIQCRISRKMVDARHLIRDVLPSYLLEELTRHGISRHEAPPPPEPAPRKEVFVSYAWTEESRALVDKLQEAFQGRDITLVRDKSEMRYKDSIRDFMKRIGRGKCIVVVLSKKYLESKSCMFEMTEIADRGDIRNRVFPIVLDDAEIYDELSRVRYIKFWEKKRDELDAEMKGVGSENLQGIREGLDLYVKIRNTAAGIVDTLGDMNALGPEQHQGAGFEVLLRALEGRLAE